MGLDMYAYSVSKKDAISPFKIKTGGAREQIFYWRKHHDLHGWMEKRWLEKLKDLGKLEDPDLATFNCAPLALGTTDLDDLEAAVVACTLPKTVGLFFGDFPPSEESAQKDLEFICKARKEIEKGNVVYYDSWW
jgi:hypothetical protein